MSKLGTTIRSHISPNSTLAKALTILYALWLLITFNIIINTYSHMTHQFVSWLIVGMSIVGSFIPILINVLYDGVYTVFTYGNSKRRKEYLGTLDERQLQTRREIFEKSYALLTTLIFLATFLGSSWFGNNMSQNGVFSIGYNVFILVVSMPTLIAVWDKNPLTHIAE